MNRCTFDAFREFIYARSGIAIRAGKQAMLRARIGKRMRATGLRSCDDYLELVKRDETGEELVHLLDAVSTNTTSFYRERQHFTLLRSLLESWQAKGQQRFRIWSAACSSGEEPYSIAMTALEALRSRPVDLRILATDISTRMLEAASAGKYGAERMAAVPAHHRCAYFEKSGRGAEAVWHAGPPLRARISFSRLNLSEAPYPMSGPFDCVFCRNVMIYFDQQGRRALLNEIYRLLRPGGYLMVGHAEGLTGLVSHFRAVAPSVYIKPASS